MDNNDVAGPAVAFDAVGAVGQQLRPVSDSLIKARLLARMPVYVVAFVAAVAAAVLHSPWWWIAAALAGVTVGWQLWLIPHQVRCIGWAEGEDDLFISRGKLWHTTTIVPYGRIQYIDIDSGPIDSRYGLVNVSLNTASTTSITKIPGLPAQEAEELRRRVSQKAKTRMSGM